LILSHTTERESTARENNRVSPASASEVSAAGARDRETHSKWSQTTMSSESPSDQHEKVSSSSSARRCTSSESGSAGRRDPSSRDTFSAELSSTGMPLERTDDNRRRSVKPSATTNCGYPGIPIRFFPGYNTHTYSASPRVQKAARNYTLTPSSSSNSPEPAVLRSFKLSICSTRLTPLADPCSSLSYGFCI